MAEKKRLLSGVKPTGRPHIGNYFGAMKQFVDLQQQYESFVFVADYHALTTPHSQKNPEEIRESIKDIVRIYMAIGIDPNVTTIFKQSDVVEHTELAWLFECITTMPYLMRAHAFKDAEAKNKEISVGTFNYPMLMAADILLYDPAVVPVGKDQQQHVEYARDTAIKFNNLYGETFAVPEHVIIEDVAMVPGTDGQKMSKSYNNTIPLFGTEEETLKAVMGIVTDSGADEEMENLMKSNIQPGSYMRPINLYRIHTLFKHGAELTELYGNNQNNYKIIKEKLAADINAYLAPMRAKYKAITDEEVKKVLADGAQKARAIASAKMADVRQKVGVSL